MRRKPSYKVVVPSTILLGSHSDQYSQLEPHLSQLAAVKIEGNECGQPVVFV